MIGITLAAFLHSLLSDVGNGLLIPNGILRPNSPQGASRLAALKLFGRSGLITILSASSCNLRRSWQGSDE